MKQALKRIIEKYPRLWEIFKFLLIGGLATIVDYLFMALTLYILKPSAYPTFLSMFFGNDYVPPVYASVLGTAVGFLFGLLFNYLFSLIFVFTASDTSKAKGTKGFAIFAGLSLIGLGIHTLGMYIGVELMHINQWIMKIILTVIVLVFNYITRKKILFKTK